MCVIKKVLHYNAYIAKASVFVFVCINNGDARENNENCICLLEKVTILALWPHICPVIQAICFDPINFRTKYWIVKLQNMYYTAAYRESSVSWKCNERNICSIIFFFFLLFGNCSTKSTCMSYKHCTSWTKENAKKSTTTARNDMVIFVRESVKRT